MSEWKRVKLGDCLEFLNGKSIKVQSCGVWPVYGSNGIIGYSEQYLYENAIVLGRVGAYCGSVARESGKFWASDNTIVVKSKDSVDIDFCYYQMKIMRLNNYAGGAAQPLITHSILNGLSLSLPSLATQRRIASVLSNYDSAIANCRRQIALLEEAAMRLYKEWFKDGKGEKKKIGDFVKIKRGKVITKATAGTGVVPVIAAGLEPAYYTNRSNVSAPSITISASGANAGYVGFHHDDIWASDCSYISRNETPYVYFTYAVLMNNSNAIRNLQKGAAQPHVHASDVERIDMVVPSETMVNRYEEHVKPFFISAGLLTQQIRALTEARDRILPKLMKGEIAV